MLHPVENWPDICDPLHTKYECNKLTWNGRSKLLTIMSAAPRLHRNKWVAISAFIRKILQRKYKEIMFSSRSRTRLYDKPKNLAIIIILLCPPFPVKQWSSCYATTIARKEMLSLNFIQLSLRRTVGTKIFSIIYITRKTCNRPQIYSWTGESPLCTLRFGGPSIFYVGAE